MYILCIKNKYKFWVLVYYKFIVMKWIVCENIRSWYNVGNIIRTADALWWWVVLVWYTANTDHKEVIKTSLWAEKIIPIKRLDKVDKIYIKEEWKNNIIISAEFTWQSIPLQNLKIKFNKITNNIYDDIYLIMWNEVIWVEQETIDISDIICHIPMTWIKESLNVGQAAAIFMREINRIL